MGMSHERIGLSVAEQDDLEWPKLSAFLREQFPTLLGSLSEEEVATRAGLTAKMATKLSPSVAGLYTFGRYPELAFPEWGVSCLAFSGGHITAPIRARAELGGPLASLAEHALAFALDHTGGAGSGRFDSTVLRELITNALVHRDLRRPGRVALRVFDHRERRAPPRARRPRRQGPGARGRASGRHGRRQAGAAEHASRGARDGHELVRLPTLLLRPREIGSVPKS